MGKDWYWGGKSSRRGGQNVDRDAISSSSSSSSSSAGCMCAVFQLFDFHQFQFTSLNHPHHEPASSFKPTTSRNTTSTTLYQLPQEADNIPKGVEAPRNSLKSEEGSTSLSSIIEEEDEESLNLNIPMGIQIKTSTGPCSRSAGKSGLSPSDFSSDTSSNSPGTKTPSLVARLMGLDLLPESSSPTIHATQKQQYLSRSHTQPLRSRQPRLRNKARHLLDGDSSAGTRSLPETPRVSSARRSDVDQHHRLSLQINKENIVDHDLNLDFSKLSALRRKQLRVEEHACESSSRSPGHYARQIVKQAKESVSRKVGLDVTNTILITRNRSDNHHHELVNQLKSKRSSVSKPSLSKLEEQASRSGKQNSSSSMSTTTSSSSTCSPRLMTRFTDSKTSTNHTTTPLSTSPKDHQTSKLSTVKVNGARSNPKGTHYQTLQEQQQQQQQKIMIKSKINNINDHIVKGGNYGREIGGATFGRRLQKMQEETFVLPSTAASCRTNIPDKKKCKKTPLSNNLINLNVVVPTLLPLKKTPNSPPSTSNKHVFSSRIQPTAAEVPDDAQESKRSSQLSSSQSQKYYSQGPQPSSHVLHTRDIIINDVVHVPNGVATSATATSTATTARRGGSKSELQILRHYISRILARTGIANTSHVSFTNWFSPSHPLDPSIFHRLEISMYVNNNNNNVDLSNVGQFRLGCNRRLLFDVVDEILVDILRPYINLKPWINNYSTNNAKYYINIGSELIDTLCSRIQRFPCRDCQVLEDIDALIDKDMPDRFMKIQKEMAFEEEGEGLVTEIERDIVDTLVHETALILVGTW